MVARKDTARAEHFMVGGVYVCGESVASVAKLTRVVSAFDRHSNLEAAAAGRSTYRARKKSH